MTVDITSRRPFSFVDTSRQRASAPVAAFVVVAVTLLAACGSSTSATDSQVVPTAVAVVADEAAVTTADLVATLQGAGLVTLASAIEQIGDTPLLPTGAFTILAPSDEAFLTLTSDETADVLTDPELLLRTLQNHIVDGRLSAAELGDRTSVTTIAGTELAVVIDDGVLTVGGATVSSADLAVDRGLVHTMDAVLVP